MYALSWILRNTDLKYSKYYSLLMLGSNHVAKICTRNTYSRAIAIITLTYSYSGYWLDRLVLRDVLNTPLISRMSRIRGWAGGLINDEIKHS